jgi:hypothetical protein
MDRFAHSGQTHFFAVLRQSCLLQGPLHVYATAALLQHVAVLWLPCSHPGLCQVTSVCVCVFVCVCVCVFRCFLLFRGATVHIPIASALARMHPPKNVSATAFELPLARVERGPAATQGQPQTHTRMHRHFRTFRAFTWCAVRCAAHACCRSQHRLIIAICARRSVGFCRFRTVSKTHSSRDCSSRACTTQQQYFRRNVVRLQLLVPGSP